MAEGPIDGVSFDAGFTLVEPRVSIRETYLGVARGLGVEIEDEDFGRHLRSCWTRVDRDFRSRDPSLRTSEELERAAWHAFTAAVAAPYPDLSAQHSAWHERLVNHFDDPGAWRMIAGVPELLDGLGARGVPCVVTSNWHGALHGILRSLGIHGRFRAVLTSAEVGRKKPHAEIFRAMMRALDDPSGRVLHVGDSWGDDVEGARRLGIEPVWFAPRGDAPPDGEARVIRDPVELLDLFADA